MRNLKFGAMKFYLDKDGLWKYERGGWRKDMYHLGLIIVNPELVVKLPFKPQYGDEYWQNSAFDYFAYKSGYVFPY